MRDRLILESTEKTPEALWKWMHENVAYDYEIGGWRLKTPTELLEKLQGNCHDQSFFASYVLHRWKIPNWQLFFVEFSKDSNEGGNTHTLTYFQNGNSYYWFENAWEDHAGIHGPYSDKEEIKDAVFKVYRKDTDINSNKFDGIVFGETHHYRTGMNLHDYVNSWDIDEEDYYLTDGSDEDRLGMKFFRVVYDGKGIYQALKQQMPPDVWKRCLEDQTFNWLPKPPTYAEGYQSWFTEKGYQMFLKTVGPLLRRYLDKSKIKVRYSPKISGKIIYKDSYQVIVDNGSVIKEQLEWIDKFVHDQYFRESIDRYDLPEPSSEYDPPYSKDEVIEKYGEEKYQELSEDPAHLWRMETGIELIHQEPTLEELVRICSNWQAMSPEQKQESDQKSMELFGKSNMDHYKELILLYECYEYLDESNKGLLQVAHRLAKITDEGPRKGHFIHIFYDLNGDWEITQNNTVSDQSGLGYRFAMGGPKGKEGRDQIRRKGNTDFQSKGHLVKSIRDLSDGNKIIRDPIHCQGPFGGTANYGHTPILIQMGKIDNNPTFKSTMWSFVEKDGRWVYKHLGVEGHTIRGQKGKRYIDTGYHGLYQFPKNDDKLKEKMQDDQDTVEKFRYYDNLLKSLRHSLKVIEAELKKHPEYEEIRKDRRKLRELRSSVSSEDQEKINDLISGRCKLEDLNLHSLAVISLSFTKINVAILDIEKSMEILHFKHSDVGTYVKGYDKFKSWKPGKVTESVEEVSSVKELLDQCNSPEDLYEFMKSIQYGWTDQSGKVNGTGDHDETSHFSKEYRLQSPEELLQSKIGVCWDQVELERVWFREKGYDFAVICVEADDGDDQPTHSFIVYKENGKVHWFEGSWKQVGGSHPYDSIQECLSDIVDRLLKDWNLDKPTHIYHLVDSPKAGCTCEEYYDLAHNSTEIQLNHPNLFTEAFNLKIPKSKKLPDVMYFSSPSKIDELKGQVFLSPYAGISSMFIINRHELLREYASKKLGHKVERSSFNIGYDEWQFDDKLGFNDDRLKKPLKMAHLTHNVPDFKETFTGESKGYIYEVDISDVKDKLYRHGRQSIYREVIYRGEKPLKILKVIPHTIKWEFRFDEENMKRSGKGFIESGGSSEDFDVFMEKQSLETRNLRDFKMRYRFKRDPELDNPHLGTITVNRETYYVDIDFYSPTVSHPEVSPGKKRDTAAFMLGNRKILIVLDRDFFNVSGDKKREAILQHEIGHIRKQFMGVSDDHREEQSKWKQSASQYEKKGTHANVEEFEADRYAANRTSEKDMMLGLQRHYRQQGRKISRNMEKKYRKLTSGEKDQKETALECYKLYQKDPKYKKPKLTFEEFRKYFETEIELEEEWNDEIEDVEVVGRGYKYYVDYRKLPREFFSRAQDINQDMVSEIEKTQKKERKSSQQAKIERESRKEEERKKKEERSRSANEDQTQRRLALQDPVLRDAKYLKKESVQLFTSLLESGILGEDDGWAIRYLIEAENQVEEENNDSNEEDSQEQPQGEIPEPEEIEEPPSIEETPQEDSSPDISEQEIEPSEEPSQEEPTETSEEEEPASDNTPIEDQSIEEEPKKTETSKEKKESAPKKIDRKEKHHNGRRRKKLYKTFIDWCKESNPKNTFGNVYDEDAFTNAYTFVPPSMMYFYRIANPMLCVLQGNLTFFPLNDLKKINSENRQRDQFFIFAANENEMRVLNLQDKKVYQAIDNNGTIETKEVLGDSFDKYIQELMNTIKIV